VGRGFASRAFERYRLWLGALLAAVALAAALALLRPPPAALVAPRVQIRSVRNGVVRSGLPFRFQPLREPALDSLGRREGLDAVVALGDGELDRIVKVREWVAAQFPVGEPNPTPPWNALTILDWIRSGKTGGFCAQYAQVMLQSLAYLGWSGRYIEIGSRANPFQHYLLEVWSNSLEKWIVMDPDFNLHFERDGIPQSALEVHRALVAGGVAEVRPVLGQMRKGHPDPFQYPSRTRELYYYLRFHLRADQLTDAADPIRRFEDMVEWQDAETVRWEQSTVASQFEKRRLTARATSEAADAYPRLNQVRVEAGSVAGDQVTLSLSHDVFDFDHYELAFAAGAGWRRHDGHEYRWRLVPGMNMLLVRGVNARGVAGPSAMLMATCSAPGAP
jgi:hypothetical protein